MADMDLDDLLDAKPRAPTRVVRFAPKGGKLNPKPKIEPSQPLPPSASDPMDTLPLPKKEEPKPEIEPDIKPEHANGAMEMDVEVKPDVKVKEDLMETEVAESVLDPIVKESTVDEVVREIDVYLNHSVDPNTCLHVWQYPLRPLWRPYELDEKCDEVRVKPSGEEVEIDLAVDTYSKNYDTTADPKLQMQKQTLRSTWMPPHASGQAVAVLFGNKLYLNPIHAVVQLRPSMKHLDAEDSKKKKTNARSNTKDSVKLEDPQPSGAQTKPDWVPLKYHSARSDMAATYVKNMMAREVEGSQISFSMSSNDYINSLCPGTSSGSFSSNVPPIRSLLALPLKERFKTWLLEANTVHRFDALKHLAPDESIEEVLEVLQDLARLVQGLWFPKSRLVYGIDHGLDVLARDYVLALFSKNVIITNSQLPLRPQLANAMKDVLNVLAVERPAFDDWKLKASPDSNFIKLNQSIVKKHEEEWQGVEKKINDDFNVAKNKAAMRSNAAKKPAIPKSSSNVETRTPNVSTSRTAMSDDVREAIKKALQKLFKSIKVCSLQQISQRLRDMAVSESTRSTGFSREAVAAANSIDAYPDELQAIISEVAVNIHGICVPKSSPDHPQYDPFRKVVIDLFIAEGPNAKIKKASMVEAAKVELKRDIPPNEYQKVVQELCLSQGSAWVLKSTG
ncbi:hypothetical protein ABFX02_08G073800 [Erythranthe guttata]